MARSGRQPKRYAPARRNKYVPPLLAKGLTREQRRELEEIRQHRMFERADESLLLDYRRTMLVRDKAAEAINEHGVLIDGGKRANPAAKILKDAQHRLSEIRKVLRMGPLERAELLRSGLLEPAADDDDDDIYID